MSRLPASAALVLFAAASLGGCARYRLPPAVPPTTVAIYRCADDTTMKVTFDNGRNIARAILGDGSITTLRGQPVGSGIHYANDWYDLRGKGLEATFTVKNRAPITCVAEA